MGRPGCWRWRSSARRCPAPPEQRSSYRAWRRSPPGQSRHRRGQPRNGRARAGPHRNRPPRFLRWRAMPARRRRSRRRRALPASRRSGKARRRPGRRCGPTIRRRHKRAGRFRSAGPPPLRRLWRSPATPPGLRRPPRAGLRTSHGPPRDSARRQDLRIGDWRLRCASASSRKTRALAVRCSRAQRARLTRSATASTLPSQPRPALIWLCPMG